MEPVPDPYLSLVASGRIETVTDGLVFSRYRTASQAEGTYLSVDIIVPGEVYQVELSAHTHAGKSVMF